MSEKKFGIIRPSESKPEIRDQESEGLPSRYDPDSGHSEAQDILERKKTARYLDPEAIAREEEVRKLANIDQRFEDKLRENEQTFRRFSRSGEQKASKNK